MERIYLDYNASTPIAPSVLEAMLPWLRSGYGNASSIHWAGRAAQNAVEDAREQLAGLLGARTADVIFTSGGTESDNTAIASLGLRLAERGRHIITTAVEHSAVLAPCRWLRDHHGFELTLLGVDKAGRIDPAALREAMRPDTVLVSVMLANNELGNIYPIRRMAEIAHEGGAVFHTDAVQAIGKIPVDFEDLGVDLLSLSGHKLYGPKGVGALLQNRRSPFAAMQLGGGQERGRRGGTANTAGIVGLGAACALALECMDSDIGELTRLRDLLVDEVMAGLDGVLQNGDTVNRTPNTANLSFAGIDGESLVLSLDLKGVAAATGAACSSGSTQASHVLMALGHPDHVAQGSLRFSVGRPTTEEEVRHAAAVVVAEVERLRELGAD